MQDTNLCPNCGAYLTNSTNCEYCGTFVSSLSDNIIQQNSFDSSYTAFDYDILVKTAEMVIRQGVFTENHSSIAVAWLPDNGCAEDLVEYNSGNIMIAMVVERDEVFTEVYKDIPKSILCRFVYMKNNDGTEGYYLNLGCDYSYAAKTWIKVLRGQFYKRGIKFSPKNLILENIHGKFNYRGEMIEESDCAGDILCDYTAL